MLENQYAVQCKTLLLGTMVFSSFPQIQFPLILASRKGLQCGSTSACQIKSFTRYPSRSFISERR